jgi:adenosylcobinamide-GDP ribazoletransferase
MLSRLPVPARVGEDPGRALPWFPLVGVLVGLVTASVYAAAYQVLPPPVAATVAILSLVLLTGALHEDGLADSADAWGGDGRDDTLRIMRDPQHGTFGALAIVFSVVLRIGALAALSPAFSLVALPAIHAVSRTAPVMLMALTPAARDEGQAAHFISAATPAQAAVASGSALVVSIVLLGVWVIAAVAIVITIAWLIRRAAVLRLGGLTGDVLGATEQLVECGLLVLLAGVAKSTVPPA